MDHSITAHIGLDVHKDSIAVAVAEPGRSAPRLVGTTGPRLTELCKALARLPAYQIEVAPRRTVAMRNPARGHQSDQTSLEPRAPRCRTGV